MISDQAGFAATLKEITRRLGDLERASQNPVNPRGFVGQSTTTTAQNGVGTSATVLSNIAVIATVVAGRRYKITGEALARQRVAAGVVYLELYDSTNGVVLQTAEQTIRTADDYATLLATIVHTPGASGAITYRLRGRTSGNTVDYHGDVTIGALIVEDIGT